MARSRYPFRRRLTVSALVHLCSVFHLRLNGGGVLAQGDGSDDNTDSPSGAPASLEDDDSLEYPDCPGYTSHIKDGYCDLDLNIASCGWDGGDCCPCTCGQGMDSADELAHPCGEEGDGYDCQDPDVPDDCGATPSPAASFGYPDCDGYMTYNFQNSLCNDDLNNAECGWDGGDCCRCTCRDYGYVLYGYKSCGLSGFDCLDPEAPNDCDTASPTPSPAATSGYPGCEGIIIWIGDGYCDSPNNNEECGWDGGDCCPCTCRGTDFYECSDFFCLDPEAPTDCTTDSPTPSPAAASGYPGCEGPIFWLGDGTCHTATNVEECGYDGGDCCFCGSFDVCLDPAGSTDCPTPSPAVTNDEEEDDDTLDYAPECEGIGIVSFIGDGECDDQLNNNSECLWDGGDCCSCDCGEDGVNSCGISGFRCLDPSSVCQGTSSGFDDGHDDDPEDSAASVQDIVARGSSDSSFSFIDMIGVFALSASTFVLFGFVVLAACGVLRPRWCCFVGEKEDASASAIAAEAAPTPSASKRSSPLARFQQRPHSSRRGAQGALAVNADRRPRIDETSAIHVETGVVRAQEGKDADEAKLGGAFRGTGGTGGIQGRSAEAGNNEEMEGGEKEGHKKPPVAHVGNADAVEKAEGEKEEEGEAVEKVEEEDERDETEKKDEKDEGEGEKAEEEEGEEHQEHEEYEDEDEEGDGEEVVEKAEEEEETQETREKEGVSEGATPEDG